MSILDEFRDNHKDFNKDGEGVQQVVNPEQLMEKWLQDAMDQGEAEPNAFVLSTVFNNQPSSRVVYLKGQTDEGYVFYTNYKSLKASGISQNEKVSMLFFWPKQSRQIRIEGVCKKVSEEMSEAYFNSRPRASQLGAWASEQSAVLNDRLELTDRLDELEKKYPNEVPRPEHWGGYVIVPTEFEFWQGMPSRLHDRLIFSKEGDHWSVFRKNP